MFTKQMQSKKWLLYIISFKREAIDSINLFSFFPNKDTNKRFRNTIALKGIAIPSGKRKRNFTIHACWGNQTLEYFYLNARLSVDTKIS